MVNIAIAGGSGQVSKEIIDALIASKRHNITILSRNAATATTPKTPGLHWKTVDYNDKSSLIDALKDVHTVLSFIQLLSDPDQMSQRNLIDAAIAAGVKRFSPSEYGSKGLVDMHWWMGKEQIRKYLAEVNAKEQVLEYTLFQPGLFLEYLAYPYKTSKYLDPLQTVFDFQNKRAIVVEGYEDTIMTFTTVADLAAVIARAVEYEGKWPVISGIRGNRVTVSEVVEIGRRVRGASFTIDKVAVTDLESGHLNTSWSLEAVHQAVSDEEASSLLKAVSIGILLSSTKGAWDSSNEWNQLLPEFEFTKIEDFLVKVWEGKP